METRTSKELLPACFTAGTADFAMHPSDVKHAKTYLEALINEGKSWEDARNQIIEHFANRKPKPPTNEHIEKQIKLAKEFLKPALDENTGE